VKFLPDGKYDLIESDRHFNTREWKIDTYKLALEGCDKNKFVIFTPGYFLVRQGLIRQKI
jgi:hypothetical protein